MNQALEVYRHGGLEDIIAITRTQEDRPDGRDPPAGGDHDWRTERIADHPQRRFLRPVPARHAARRRHQCAAIAVLVLFYNLIRRSFRPRLHAERALQNNNEQLESLVPRAPSNCRCCRAT
jgi:hypothetical protein